MYMRGALVGVGALEMTRGARSTPWQAPKRVPTPPELIYLILINLKLIFHLTSTQKHFMNTSQVLQNGYMAHILKVH